MFLLSFVAPKLMTINSFDWNRFVLSKNNPFNKMHKIAIKLLENHKERRNIQLLG